MTVVSEIITDAYRQSNLLAIGVTPTTLQQTEALRYLNRIVKSVYGQEAGDPLTPLPIGRNNIERPAGFPWYDVEAVQDWFIPSDVQIVLNLETAKTLYLDPMPEDGQRFAVLDASGNLATYNLTLDGNGRKIEGADTAVLNTNGLSRYWFYRADTGSWQRVNSLVAGDTFPFPEEFDDLFITMLAMRLNPSYATSLDPQSQAVWKRSLTQFRARYNQVIPQASELALVRLSQMAADRDQFTKWWAWVNDPRTAFNVGRSGW